jgi:hypothetical protein
MFLCTFGSKKEMLFVGDHRRDNRRSAAGERPLELRTHTREVTDMNAQTHKLVLQTFAAFDQHFISLYRPTLLAANTLHTTPAMHA